LAKTEEEFLESFRQRTNNSDLLPGNIQERGRLDILYGIMSAELSNHEERIEQELINTNLITATDPIAIKNLSAPYYTGAQATYAQTILTITRNGITGDIYIPAGTYVETSGKNPIQFTTFNSVYLYAPQNSVKVKIKAVKKGVSSMVSANTINQVTGGRIAGISVKNSQQTWGGYNDETSSKIKSQALSARFSMAKCTKRALDAAMFHLQIEPYRYNLVEFPYGIGSAVIYFDAYSEEELKFVQGLMNREFAFGIYHRIEQATNVDITFKIDTEVFVDSGILTPSLKATIQKTIEKSLKEYISINGVGKRFIRARAIRYLLHELDSYGVQDIEIATAGYPTDSKGNITIKPQEVFNAEAISVSVNVA
jgi:hypothetical protein